MEEAALSRAVARHVAFADFLADFPLNFEAPGLQSVWEMLGSALVAIAGIHRPPTQGIER